MEDEAETEAEDRNTSNCTWLDCPCGAAKTTELEETSRMEEANDLAASFRE